jgi:two-component system LytT family response regulator
MNVMIVDDEPAGRRTLRECCASQPDVTIVGEFGDPRAALTAIRASKPDVVFLDIRMDTMSGTNLARALDPKSLPIVVFVTAYDEYAVEAFELSATDYLLKPFDDERFRRMLDRVRERHEAGNAAERAAALSAALAHLDKSSQAAGAERPRLLAEAAGTLHMLDVASIEIVEADRNYVRITVGRNTYHARSTLQHAQNALRSQPMLRVSRSCLVNVNHLREINRTLRGDFILVLAGGVTVTSSEGFRDKVREYLDTLRLGAAR